MAFGNHLRADQHVDLAGAEPPQQRRQRAFARMNRDRGGRRAPGQARLTSASTRSVPNPACSRYGPAQCGQRRWDAHREVAIVTARPPRHPLAVHDQRDAAVGTIERPGALPAEDRGRETAAIEEHERLFTTRQPNAERIDQRPAEHDFGPATAYSSRMSTTVTAGSGRSHPTLEDHPFVAAVMALW